jgi:hypothetical protein
MRVFVFFDFRWSLSSCDAGAPTRAAQLRGPGLSTALLFLQCLGTCHHPQCKQPPCPAPLFWPRPVVCALVNGPPGPYKKFSQYLRPTSYSHSFAPKPYINHTPPRQQQHRASGIRGSEPDQQQHCAHPHLEVGGCIPRLRRKGSTESRHEEEASQHGAEQTGPYYPQCENHLWYIDA